MTSAAIVTTLKNQGPSLVTFVNYHLSIGFERIYLVFDDPTDSDQQLVAHIPQVKVIPGDARHRAQWPSLYRYPRYEGHIDKEVRARQSLNAELVLKMALDEGIDWLLHIDADELFWPAQSTIHPHLKSLAREGVVSASYFNFEGVPVKEDIEDYFLEVDTFKRPRKLLQKQGINLREVWTEDARYFNFYTNGKSMCRVREDMVPSDVHEWRSKEQHIHTAKFYYPAILHFSCCGYQYFKSKFQKHMDYGSEGMRFGISLKDRGFVLDYEALMAYKSGNEELARQMYREKVMLTSSKIEYYKEKKLLETMDVSGRITK